MRNFELIVSSLFKTVCKDITELFALSKVFLDEKDSTNMMDVWDEIFGAEAIRTK